MAVSKMMMGGLLNFIAVILVVLMAVPFSCFLASCWLDRRIEGWSARRRRRSRERHELARLAGLRV